MQLLGVEKQDQQKQAASFLLKLKEVCTVSERTIREVIAGYETLSSYSLSVVRARLSEVLGEAGICMSDIKGLDEVFNDVPCVFDGLETTYRQEKYFSEVFHCLVSINCNGYSYSL